MSALSGNGRMRNDSVADSLDSFEIATFLLNYWDPPVNCCVQNVLQMPLYDDPIIWQHNA